jgi:hypothetical protein
VRYRHDELSRLTAEVWTVDGEVHRIGYGYDERGRQRLVTYPTTAEGEMFEIDYVPYSHGGYLKEIHNALTGEPYWEAVAYAADGNVLQERFGNGVRTHRTYDRLGRLRTVDTSADDLPAPI